MTTPLPPVDHDLAGAFWARAVAAGAVDPAAPVPATVEPFGDSVELADELVALVVEGRKRATAGALPAYELDGDPLPVVGDLWVATDGSGRARAVVRTTEVRVGPLGSVDDAFAWDEGEGDRSLAHWRRVHDEFFAREGAALGYAVGPDLPVVFERFDVPYAEEPERR